MNINEITYWVTLASMPKMWTKRKNQLFVECYKHEPRYSIVDLFERPDIRIELGVTPDEEALFTEAHDQLANYAFMTEDLLNQGYDILPITSPDYPQSLKKNLKQSTPCVIYVKGNKTLLNTEATAIVGSRKADNISLEFTNIIAKTAVKENKTIVSGFAKGVDRQALDATIEANGASIIILPQGITTFASGFRQYYEQICMGKVTVISTFHPKAPWSKELAMARNSIIYGLATEIYVAQSDNKGGTWSGVIQGLKKGQKIYIRVPESNEKNANMLLIQKGGIGVDLYGNLTTTPYTYSTDSPDHILCSEPNITTTKDSSDNDTYSDIKKSILESLTAKKTSKEILSALKSDWSDAKMKKYLRSLPEVDEEKRAGKVYFFKKGYKEQSLFDM